ncbi:MAG: GTP 3',8-cyclase MoaA [Candidatus Thorarchaeota archaeon]
MTSKQNEILVDKFNRQVKNLRLSVIDRCNLRCRYCIVNETVNWIPTDNLLTFDEYIRLVKIFSSLGIHSIRITGGEPLVRPRICSLIGEISKISGINHVSMTTNGVLLDKNIDLLNQAGLKSLNISLDTLNPDKFYKITRRDQFSTVISNIKQALEYPIKVKINCVALKNFNDNEFYDFVEFSIENDVTIRFIEFMPFNGNNWLEGSYIPSKEIKEIIEKKYTLITEPLEDPSQTSRNYKIEGNSGKIGFISSVSESFCQWCNRIRITAEGALRTCLHDSRESDLRHLLRAGSTDDQIKNLIKKSVFEKQKGHVDWIDPSIIWNIPLDDREMIKIGG